MVDLVDTDEEGEEGGGNGSPVVGEGQQKDIMVVDAVRLVRDVLVGGLVLLGARLGPRLGASLAGLGDGEGGRGRKLLLGGRQGASAPGRVGLAHDGGRLGWVVRGITDTEVVVVSCGAVEVEVEVDQGRKSEELESFPKLRKRAVKERAEERRMEGDGIN